MRFLINEKEVTYFDEIWKDGVKIYPKDEILIRKMVRSGKPNIKILAALIMDANKGENLKQYNNCQTETEISDMIVKDCMDKGLTKV